jgi:predicted ArsR family transcriptional regulator
MVRRGKLSKTAQRRKPAESPRDAALRILKIRTEMTIIELTRSLKLTETAVRRHLQKLQHEGLVSYSPRAQTQGRPVNVYRLTEKATTDYFPTGYQELAARTLDTIFDADGHRGVFDFLVAANQRITRDTVGRLSGKSLRERVQTVAAHFKDNGYMTDFRELPEGKFFLYHQNCAIYNLAAKYKQLCFVELKLIEALVGAKVTREQYIFKGQPICGYLIHPGAAG